MIIEAGGPGSGWFEDSPNPHIAKAVDRKFLAKHGFKFDGHRKNADHFVAPNGNAVKVVNLGGGKKNVELYVNGVKKAEGPRFGVGLLKKIAQAADKTFVRPTNKPLAKDLARNKAEQENRKLLGLRPKPEGIDTWRNRKIEDIQQKLQQVPAGDKSAVPDTTYRPGWPNKVPNPKLVEESKTLLTKDVSVPGDKYTKIEQDLKNATIIRSEVLGTSASRPVKLTLDDGTTGVWKGSGKEPCGVRSEIGCGQQTSRELGAWSVAKIVGIDDMLQPTVAKDNGGKPGVFSKWVDGAHSGAIDKIDKSQLAKAAVFDFVIGNLDRNSGNFLLDKNDNLHLIDHGLAFPKRHDSISPVGGFFGSGFGRLYRAALQNEASPAEGSASSYADNKSTIEKALTNVGLPAKDVAKTMARIDIISNAKRFPRNNIEASLGEQLKAAVDDILGGGPGSGVYYHVTHSHLVESIKKNGIKTKQTSNWVTAKDKKRYGQGEVNAFNNKEDAHRWAAKMDWAFNKGTGTGKVSIIAFKPGDHVWHSDTTSDPLTKVQYKGDWLKSNTNVLAKDIVSVTPLSKSMVRALVMSGGGHSINAEEKPFKEQKKEWPLQAEYTFQGLNICIENKKGSIRSGKEPNGKPWSIKMPFDYGYIKSTKGSDGDEVDCFIGPDKKATHVFIVHQRKNNGPECSEGEAHHIYDEDKCFLGWSSADAAKKAYHSAYKNVELFTSMTMMSIKEFKQKLEDFRGKKLHAALQAGGPGSGRHKEAGKQYNIKELKKEGVVRLLQSENRSGTVVYSVEYPHKVGNENINKRMQSQHLNKAEAEKEFAQFSKALNKDVSAGGPGSGRKKIKFLSVTKSGKSQYPGQHQYVLNYLHNGQNKYAYHTAGSVKEAKEALLDHLERQGQLEAGGPGSGRKEEFRLTPPKSGRLSKLKERTQPTDKELVKSGLAKKWKHQTDAERHAIARHDARQKSLLAGGPGSGRHPWGRKAKPSKELKKLQNRAKFLQHHSEKNTEYLRNRYQQQQEQNKAEGNNARGHKIISTKQKIAVKNVVIIDKSQQAKAETGEQLVTKALHGEQQHNNSPMDVTLKLPNGKIMGLEVKSMLLQKQDRIYIKGNALTRKVAWGKDNKAPIGTVALDFRSNPDKPDVYYKSGVGAFHIGSMQAVQGGLKGLAQAIGGK